MQLISKCVKMDIIKNLTNGEIMDYRLFCTKPTNGVDVIKLINSNFLIKNSEYSYLLFINLKDNDEVIKVVKQKDENDEEYFMIRKFSMNGPSNIDRAFLTKGDSWVFEKYISEYSPSKYEYDDLESVINYLNNYLYELY